MIFAPAYQLGVLQFHSFQANFAQVDKRECKSGMFSSTKLPSVGWDSRQLFVDVSKNHIRRANQREFIQIAAIPLNKANLQNVNERRWMETHLLFLALVMQAQVQIERNVIYIDNDGKGTGTPPETKNIRR